jgi:chorismate mutase
VTSFSHEPATQIALLKQILDTCNARIKTLEDVAERKEMRDQDSMIVMARVAEQLRALTEEVHRQYNVREDGVGKHDARITAVERLLITHATYFRLVAWIGGSCIILLGAILGVVGQRLILQFK